MGRPGSSRAEPRQQHQSFSAKLSRTNFDQDEEDKCDVVSLDSTIAEAETNNNQESNSEDEEQDENMKKLQKMLKNNNFQQLLGSSFGNMGFNPMLLSAQLALAVQQQQQQQSVATNPFLTAYASLLGGGSSLVPALMSERLKAARFSPYSKPDFSSGTSTSSSNTSSKARTSAASALATITNGNNLHNPSLSNKIQENDCLQPLASSSSSHQPRAPATDTEAADSEAEET